MLLMKNFHRLIVDFYLKDIEEAMILSCFTDEDNILVFPYYGLDYNGVNPDQDEYIRQRTLYIENEYVYWYYPRDMDELLHVIQENGVCYRCQIVNMSNQTISVRFKLEIYEHYEFNGSETRALIINENHEEDYLTNIAPIIEVIVNELGLV
jgi:hypothetical protein